MSPRAISGELLRQVPVLRSDQPVREAVRAIIDADVPALPVTDGRGRLAGIFGEREFITALFPGYMRTLGYAGFVPRSLEADLEKRAEVAGEPIGDHMNTEHVDVDADFSDAQLAETFLHHRVLIVPVQDGGRVVGIITREDFFRELGTRFCDATR